MIVAGIGCRHDCSAQKIVNLVREAEARAGVAATCLAVPEFKQNESGLLAAAIRLGIALHWIDSASMAAAQARCPTRSATVAHHVGYVSVAEAAALAAVGPFGRLLLPRIAAASATCALASGNTA
jgi:cobalt-precorrin 5A hydrolase